VESIAALVMDVLIVHAAQENAVMDATIQQLHSQQKTALEIIIIGDQDLTAITEHMPAWQEHAAAQAQLVQTLHAHLILILYNGPVIMNVNILILLVVLVLLVQQRAAVIMLQARLAVVAEYAAMEFVIQLLRQ
jgi:DNA-directed RNA polymerase beta' subunit